MQKWKNWMNRFRIFYSALKKKENIFYMFFTRGLLFWVLKSLSFVPQEVNLVLLGCNLDADEIEWIRKNLKLPFYHIEEYHQDSDVWECLTQVNEYHFGWLDIDCFVLNPRFFGKMIVLEPRTFANTVWSIQNQFHEFMCTYFLFLNIDCVKSVYESGLDITPHAYSDIRVQVNISPDFACKVLSEKHKRLVSDTIKHYYDDNGKYQFDTLQLYQLAAESIGYSIHKLTHLRGYISMNMDRYFSNDIIHIGASSHFLDVSY